MDVLANENELLKYIESLFKKKLNEKGLHAMKFSRAMKDSRETNITDIQHYY